VPEAYDRNFGGQLVLFDRLFGTLNLPRGPDMPPKYGLDAPFPTTYLGQLAHPLRPPARTLSALGERP
jgi:sterol desaturase/sphingolipid hydroxylase (fatty acid hydroxylase superfamily)